MRPLAALILLVTSMVAFTTADIVATPLPAAEAAQATGGVGKFRNMIQWVNWGSAGSTISGNTKTVTETNTIAGQTFVTTCTISKVSPSSGLQAYRSGSWQGDGFDDLYNIGGTGGSNQLVVGLSNVTNAATVTFDFKCAATLGGKNFPLAGLVMADAEASGGSEYVGATIPNSATWRIIDRIKGAQCALDTTAHRNATTNRLELYGPTSNTCENNSAQFPGPSAVAFMDGATAATNVAVKGSGKSAIALGVMVQFDFGDAPTSYGDAGAALQASFNGGTVPATAGSPPSAGGSARGVPVYGQIPDATISQPLQRLGNTVDPEFDPRTIQGATASGDDTSGDPVSGGPDDEDALAITDTLVVRPGQPYTLNQTVVCRGVGKAAAWLDFNLNGTFDAGEKSQEVNCTAPNGPTNVTLTWASVPAGILPESGVRPTYLRLRMVDADETLSPTGVSNAGEVEDHRVNIATPPKLTLVKQVGGRVSAGDQFRVEVTGSGLTGGRSATTTGSTTSASTTTDLVEQNATYTITDAMAAGSSNPLSDYGRSLQCIDTAANNAAIATSGSGPWTVQNLTPGQAVRCTVTNTPRANTLDVTKTAGQVTGPDAQGRYRVTYGVTVTNSGPAAASYGPLTDAPGFAGNLIIDSATWTGQTSGNATGPGPYALAPAGTSIARDNVTTQNPTTHTWNVEIVFHHRNDSAPVTCGAGSGSGLYNRAGLPAGQESGPSTNNSACVAPPAFPSAQLSLDKSVEPIVDANGNSRVDAGDTVTYRFRVENTGPVTISAMVIDDPLVGAVTCGVTTLAPGDVETCSATYTLTQLDVDAGSVNNVATARGKDPVDRTVVSPPDSTSTQMTPSASLSLDKQAVLADSNSNGRGDVGEQISYTFTVTNSGASTVTGITITDPMFPGVTCSPNTLAPGASVVCGPVLHTITQSEVDSGSVNNSATARGKDPLGNDVPPPTDTTSTLLSGAPSITLDKQIQRIVDNDASGLTDAGDTIEYAFAVTNTGNVTLTDVAVTDPLLGAVTCVATTLAPGATTNCTATGYTITSGDQTTGAVQNVATATGAPATGPDVSATDGTSTTVKAPHPSLALVKTAGTPVDTNDSGITDAGDTIVYTFKVTNTGDVPLSAISLSDPMLQTTDPSALAACTTTSLAPGASFSCDAAPYVITASEQGTDLVNSATVTGTPPTGPPVTPPPSTTTTEVETPAPKLSLVKTAGTPVDVDDSGITDAGDTIVYTFTVTNTGNVPLTDLTINDPLLGALAVTCEVTSLDPGSATTCTSAPYTVTAADVSAGKVENSATATATPPGPGNTPGDPVTSPPSTTETPVAAPGPALELEKTVSRVVDVNSSGITDAGDEIHYAFTVTNTGNVPLNGIRVNDALLAAQTPAVSVSCPPGRLAANESVTCEATGPYVITAADEGTNVVNSATATGTPPGGGTVVTPPSTTSTKVLAPEPELTLTKTAGKPVDVNDSGITDAGDTILYTFTVTNHGNVPMTGISISDPLLASKGITISCDTTNLAPQESATCTASAPYEITAAEETAEKVVNTAIATGTPPGPGTTPGSPVDSPPATTTTTVVTPDPRVVIDKSAAAPVDANNSGITDAGDTIRYTFTVTNRGNVPLDDVTVLDAKLAGQTAPTIVITCAPTGLAPGESATCNTSAAYQITAADVASGSVENIAHAEATDADGDPVRSTPDATSTPTTKPTPALTLVKSAGLPTDVNGSGNTDAGDTVVYTFTITNTGNVPVASIVVDDPKLAALAITCDVTALAPGEVATCVAAAYTVTTADVNAGAVTNTATAEGEDPDGKVVESPPGTTTTTTTKPTPSLTLIKSAASPVDVNDSGLTDAGDTIDYTFTVTNTGNVPLASVSVSDPKLVAQGITLLCTPTSLPVGGVAQCTISEPYTVTEADEVVGASINTATATGTPPGPGTTPGTPVESPPDTTTTTVVKPQPLLTLEKSAGTPVDVNGSGITDAGDTVDYTFAITNAGNVPISDITIDDPKLAGQGITITCTPTTLAPGAAATCTLSDPYVVTAADERDGNAVNTALAKGEDPDGGTVKSPPDSTKTPTAEPFTGLAIEKTAGLPTDVNGSGNTDAGDTIAYTFTVTNTGNVPVRGLQIKDPKVGGAIACDATVVPVGGSVECRTTTPYTITAADESAGVVHNSATATGTPPGPGNTPGTPIESPPDTTTTPVTPATPGLTIAKTVGQVDDVNTSGLLDEGDTISYEFEVTNTGNVPLTAVEVNDPKLAAQAVTITCDALVDGTLGVGDTLLCRSEAYTVTAADAASGAVANSATATGTPPGPGTTPGTPIESPPDTTTTTTTTPEPALTIEKAAGPPTDVNGSGLTDAGDTIVYTFTVTNTGNVPLDDVEIVDAKLDAQNVAILCALVALAPGESTTCTSAPYRVSASDVASGAVANSAMATGTPPGPGTTPGTPIVSPPDTTTTKVTTPEPALTIEKTAGPPTDVNGSGLTDAGDTIVYTFTVTNTGNVPLDDLGIVDSKLAAQNVAILCVLDALAPGASTTCTSAPYRVTAADVAAGAVANTATATGTPPGPGTTPGTPIVSPPDTTSVPTVTPEPGLILDKRVASVVDLNGSGITDAGDLVRYEFTVTNSGNVPVSLVSVDDAVLAGAASPIGITCRSTDLAPGDATICDSTGGVNHAGSDGWYVVRSADENTGAIVNTARANGEDPDGGTIGSPPDTTSVPITLPQPSITAWKSASSWQVGPGNSPEEPGQPGVPRAAALPGDVITFSFKVKNTGNVPLTVVSIKDPMFNGGAPTECVAALTLAPGDEADCADVDYTLLSADIDRGLVHNSATATGVPPGPGNTPGTPIESPPTDTTTPLTQVARLKIVKRVTDVTDVNDSRITDAGDRLRFGFTVSNVGNVTLTDVVVDDPMLAGLVPPVGVVCDWVVSGRLVVGESVDCVVSAPYVVTGADVAATHVINVATATGTDPVDGTVASPPSTVSVPTTKPVPGLRVEKSAAAPVDANGSTITDAGDTVRYSFTVTNTGNVPMSDVHVNDPMLAAQGITTTCVPMRLFAGESAACTTSAAYRITNADLVKVPGASGAITNTATATGTPPGPGTTPGVPVESPPDTTSTPTTTPQPSMSLVKTASLPTDVNGSGLTDAGDTIAFTFTMTNIGNVPLAKIAVEDPLLADQGIDITCSPTSLGKGASATCTTSAPYRITSVDVANGAVHNVATAVGVDPDDNPVRTPEASTSTPTTAPQAQLAVDKSAGLPTDVNGSGLTDAGDTIVYTFTVANTGNVPLTQISINDSMLAGLVITCVDTALAPGGTTTCEAAAYTLSAADVASGAVANTASATGMPPGPGTTPGTPIESPPDTTTTTTTRPQPKLQIEKAAGAPTDVNASGITDVGDTIVYTFTVTNTGNVPLTQISINDPKLTAAGVVITCDPLVSGKLAVDASVVCTSAPYAITRADAASGATANTATASGTPPGPGATPGDPVTSPPDTTSTPTTPAQPGLVLEKSATVTDVNGSGLTDAGDTIDYTFTVTNTGNVPIAGVTVADPMFPSPIACAPATLAVGASGTCGPVVHIITEADEAAGSVDNSAIATGTPPGPGTRPGTPITSPPDVTSTPTTTPRPALSVLKEVASVLDVNNSGITDAPDEIRYRFTVTNTGNVPVSAVKIDDPLLAGITITCVDATLAVDAETSCVATAPYVVTEADERSGAVHNTARATGLDPDDDPVISPKDEETVPTTTPYAGLKVLKEVASVLDVNNSGITDAPDEIRYRFTVTNTGNVPVSAVKIDDPLLAGITITCVDATLAVDAETSCVATAPHVVTEADEEAGAVHNVATVSGLDPDGDPVISPPDRTTTPVTQPQPRLVIEKAGAVVDSNGSGNTDRGDQITYTFTVTNRGNVPINGITVDDPMLAAANVDITCPPTRLAPDESLTCTSEAYVVTAADERDRHVTNTATAEGEDPDGDPVKSPPDTHTVPTTPAQPGVSLVKAAGVPSDVNDNGRVDAGDTIAYTFTVTNTGNVPVTGLAVSDPLLTSQAITIACDPAVLAAGDSVVCAASAPYRITQADVDSSGVDNTASATGNDPWGDPVKPVDDSTSTPTSTVSELTVEKSAGKPADTNGNGRVDAGDTIAYTFKVTNTGSLSVSVIRIDDPMLAGLAIVCTPTSLAAGESSTCEAAPYRITLADVDAGSVNNTAVARGETPTGDPVTSPRDGTSTPITRTAALEIDKSAALQDRDGDDKADAGEKIRYTFKVTNTGNTTLTNVRVNDPMLRRAGVPVVCRTTRLEPGESTTCSALYTVTRADTDSDKISNVAHASGNSPVGGVNSAADTAVILAEEREDGLGLPNAGGPLLGVVLAGLAMLIGGLGLVSRSRRRNKVRTT